MERRQASASDEDACRARKRAEVSEQRPIGVPPPVLFYFFFVARMNQRVRPEVAGPMTSSVISGIGIQASWTYPDIALLDPGSGSFSFRACQRLKSVSSIVGQILTLVLDCRLVIG